MAEKSLIAFEPEELAASQRGLQAWLSEKHSIVKSQIDEYQQAIAHSKKQKWGTSTLKHAHKRAIDLANYYDRALKAVEAGYLLIPPFPLQVFAVRVNREKPVGRIRNYDPPDVNPTNAPAGKGRYVDTQPFYETGIETDDKGRENKIKWASGYDTVAFPIEAVKPEIMARTSDAMVLKIFDEIGLVGGHRDPVMVGAVVLKQAYSEKRMNFFLAWWLDKDSL